MKGNLIDSNVILDLVLDDPDWASWSELTLAEYHFYGPLYINPIVYTEVSIGYDSIEALESVIQAGGFQMLEMPKEALFLAGKTYLKYRKNRGMKTSPLPDFFIGSHAAVMDLTLITRDVNRYRTYFPTVRLVYPAS